MSNNFFWNLPYRCDSLPFVKICKKIVTLLPNKSIRDIATYLKCLMVSHTSSQHIWCNSTHDNLFNVFIFFVYLSHNIFLIWIDTIIMEILSNLLLGTLVAHCARLWCSSARIAQENIVLVQEHNIVLFNFLNKFFKKMKVRHYVKVSSLIHIK